MKKCRNQAISTLFGANGDTAFFKNPVISMVLDIRTAKQLVFLISMGSTCILAEIVQAIKNITALGGIPLLI